MKQIEQIEHIEKKMAGGDDNESTNSAKQRFEVEKRQKDVVFGMLDTCKKRFNTHREIEKRKQKLMKRVDLDRPII